MKKLHNQQNLDLNQQNPNRIQVLGVLLKNQKTRRVIFIASQFAQTQSGKHFLETVGMSIVVGTVLGASIIPFYEQTDNNLMNSIYGVTGGLMAGLGHFLYQWILSGLSASQKGQSEAIFLNRLGIETSKQSLSRFSNVKSFSSHGEQSSFACSLSYISAGFPNLVTSS